MPDAPKAPAEDASSLPAAEAPGPDDVVLARASAFFARSVEKPDGLPPAEWAAFAELTLEGMAPFPLDQLAWGWHSRADSRRLLLWAAHADRLAQANPGLDGAAFAVPAHVAGLAAFAARGGRSLLVSASGDLVLLAPGKEADPLPAVLLAEPIPGDPADPAALATARERLRRRATGVRFPDTPPLLATRGRALVRGGLEIAPSSRPGEESPPATVLAEEAAWAADVRDPALRAAERRRRGRARLADRAVLGALAALAALLLLQLGLVGLRSLAEWRGEKLAARDEPVRRLQAKLSLAEKIEQFAQQELKPLQMLAHVNRHRPKEAHLTRVSTESFTELRLEGEAASAETVNTFVDALGVAPGIRSARVERVVAREGRAPFTLLVTFAPDAFAEPPAAESEPVATAKAAPPP